MIDKSQPEIELHESCSSKKQYCFYVIDEDTDFNEEKIKRYERKYNVIRHKFIKKQLSIKI